MNSFFARRMAMILPLFTVVLTTSSVFQGCEAFAPTVNLVTRQAEGTIHVSTGETALQAGLFGGLFGREKEEVDPNLPKRILEIPVQSIKMGGLRFVLGLHLIGQQNTPSQGSWKANQAGDGVLDMFYQDNTGMFSLSFLENAIVIDRYGPTPSLQYVLQESVLLHGVLDELYTLAFEGEEDIQDEDRLLQLKAPGDAIDKARELLPAKKA